MRYFRADKRDFSPGNVIQSAQEYKDKFPVIARAVEDALEFFRPPQKPKRTSCVFVFTDEKCAREHWSKMKGGKLYAVELDERDILHIGDMALMDIMKEHLDDAVLLAYKYCHGESSKDPKIEISTPSMDKMKHTVSSLACKHWVGDTSMNSEIEILASIMDKMKEYFDAVSELARKYWVGDVSKNPEIEVLAHSVSVLLVLSKSEDERRNCLKKRVFGK